MAVAHFEDGTKKEYITNGGESRLHGVKHNGKRPIKLELNQKEWDNPEFHHRWAIGVVDPRNGEVVLNKDVI